MMSRAGIAAIAVLGWASTVAAADNRIRSLAYDPDKIVQIVGRAGIQSTVEFAADERIENVAVGDSSAWQITPNRRASLLFVKPLTAHSRTNMTVVTDRRTYMFDLVAGDKTAAPVYALKFSYPNDKIAQAEAEAAEAPPQPLVASTQPAIVTAEKLHFDWQSKGYGKLLPARVFDDGEALYLAWNSQTPLPAILTMSEDRKEGPLNYRMSGEYIVVTPVPQNLVLRYGSRTAVLWPSRRITPATPPSPPAAPPATNIAQRMAGGSAVPVQRPAISPAPTGNSGNGTVKIANVTALYNDKLTGGSE